MALIQPFRALRPKTEWAAQVASRPYDVLNSEEAREEAAGNPYSFLHVTKSEIDLPPSVDIHSTEVYEKAAANLQQMIRDGILEQETMACYYIYQLVMPPRPDLGVNGHAQTGLVAVSSVKDYFGDVIKKHEFTRPEKEKDRIDHMRTIEAQTGNVFLAYRDVTEVNGLINGWKTANKPVYDFTAEDGIRHTIWCINQPMVIDSITRLFETQVPATYIADGHHRCASAAKVSQVFPDREAAQYFLTTIFPESQLAIMDYNRVVKDLNGQEPGNFLKALETHFVVSSSDSAVKPAQLHEFGLYLDGQWYRLQAKEGSYAQDPIGVLDVTILSDRVLDPLLGIKDQRTDKRIDFVGGIRGLKELEKRVDSGEMKLAFSLYPVTLAQLFAIADSGNVMPPKSTWFEPKLRDGLLTHLI